MTQQEAEALAARLTRIWNPTGSTLDTTPEKYGFEYRGYWPDRTRLIVFCPTVGVLFLALESRKKGRYCCSFSCRTDTPNRTFDVPLQHQEFTSQWLSLFRRNCWLCGCDIEASAHEKSEWMLGFPREELEAWDLKI